MDANWKDIWKRKFIVFLILFGVMLLTFFVIFIANILKPQNTNDCEGSFSKQKALEFFEQEGSKHTNVKCYCASLPPTSIPTSEGSVKEMCNDTYNDFIYLLLLTIIVGNVIVAVNYILKIVLRALGNFQKYPTITAQTMGTTMNLFFAMFINTAIITLLL